MRKSFMNTLAVVATMVFAVVVAVPASAGVNVNNGNYYVANTDFFLPTSGLNVEIARTYNSRSSYVKGYFGIGWSSEIEGYLDIKGAKIDFYEGGGGNIVSFNKDKQGNWINSLYGLQTIRKDKQGNYYLTSALGKIIGFNGQGKMISLADVNGNKISLNYKDGLVSMLQDNFNNQVKFSWKKFGAHSRIVRIERDELKASFNYSPIGNLIKAVGVDAVPYSYDYDEEHNLTKITYANGEYKEMKYNKSRDWITQFRDRSGFVTEYDYFSDSLDPENKFGTIVSRYQEGSQNREFSKFWYEFRKRADGSKFNYRSVTSISNVVTETLFTECCGTPLVVSQWPDSTKGVSKQKLDWTVAKSNKTSTYFEYFPDGLLKKKTSANGIVTALTYDPKHKKVASVQRGSRKISYGYDAKGNLQSAYDFADKRNLQLNYDAEGRISVVNETVGAGKALAKRQVYFRYDGNGRPIEIKEKTKTSEGIIKMKYAANGEVIGVYNSQGREIASEKDMETARAVTNTFQNLLEIVQPAGVTLGPEG